MDDHFNETLLELVKEKQLIEGHIEEIEKRLKTSPEGSLRVSGKSWGYQFYQKIETNDTTGNYISKKNNGLISQLAQKDYDKRLLAVLQKQLKTIDRFIANYDPRAAIEVYEQLSEPRKQLVTPVYPSDEEFVKQWLSVPYKKLGFKEEDPEYFTEKNERVSLSRR